MFVDPLWCAFWTLPPGLHLQQTQRGCGGVSAGKGLAGCQRRNVGTLL